jgi:putative MATE family efflux protein
MARLGSEDILKGPVGKTILRLAAPSIVGILSIVMFQAVDVFWVGQLGVTELAAMSFTFPVSFVVISISLGLSIGTTSVVAQAIGRGGGAQVRKLATHALLLSVVSVTLVALLGLVTIRPVFELLGAEPAVLKLVAGYMVPWYLAVGFLVIPMVGNGILRAGGDTRTPMIIMLVSSLINMGLDPLLIFGLGPFPRLELQGAAIASGISWAFVLVTSLGLLHWRERLIDFSLPRPKDVLSSWKRVLSIGAPAAATNALVPFAAAIVTRMVASYGADAVAALGVGTRVEGLALIGATSLSIATTPFVGQNFGAKHFERIRQVLNFVSLASIAWGAAVAVLLGAIAPLVAGTFSQSVAVVHLAEVYLRVIPVSYGSLGVAMLAGALLNAINRPIRASFVAVVRLFVLMVPLAYMGSVFGGVEGLFIGVSAANLIVGFFAWRYAARVLKAGQKARFAAQDVTSTMRSSIPPSQVAER